MNDLRLKINQRLKIKDLGFKISYLLILISLILILAPLAHAQQTTFPQQYLSITPIISELKLQPGKTTTFDLKVKNLANSPLGIHAEAGNLVEADTEDIREEASPLIKWTTLTDADFIIEPKQEKIIKVSIKPPSNIDEGGFYEVIYLTPFVGGQNQKEKPVVLSRIGALVFATYGELNYKDLLQKVKIDTFKPTKFLIDDREYSLDLEVSNDYFTHFAAKPVVTVSGIFGTNSKIEPEEKRILPGKIRLWQITGGVKNWGIYKAKLALSVGSGEQIIADTWFVYLPFGQWAIKTGLILIVLLILMRRRRFKKALKILTGKAQ